jgi:hypothetical protein
VEEAKRKTFKIKWITSIFLIFLIIERKGRFLNGMIPSLTHPASLWKWKYRDIEKQNLEVSMFEKDKSIFIFFYFACFILKIRLTASWGTSWSFIGMCCMCDGWISDFCQILD